MKRGLSIILIVFISVILVGCSEETQHYKTENSNHNKDSHEMVVPHGAVVGVFFSTENENTLLCWLDKNLKLLSKNKIKYSDTGSLVGYQNADDYNGKPILMTRGGTGTDSQIIAIDYQNNRAEEYNLERINPTSWSIEKDLIAIASNLDWQSYVDVLDFGSNKKMGFKVPDSLFAYTVCIGEGAVYGIAENLDTPNRYCLAKYDVDNQSAEKLLDLSDNELPSFLEYGSGQLYLISDGDLLVYNLKTERSEKIKLTREDGFNINLDSEKIWIAYTNIHDDSTESLLECREIPSGKVLYSATVSDSIWQLQPFDAGAYVLGSNTIYQFLLDENSLIETKKANLESFERNLGLGGFVVLK